MRRPSWLLACILILSLPALSFPHWAVRGDDSSAPPLPPAPALGEGASFGPEVAPAPPPLPPAPPLTLAQALAALEPPKQDLFLTVGADKVSLPPDAAPPDPDSRPGQVGAAYGRLVRDFGGVMALAPPTMVVLNTRPGVPHPYDGLPPDESLKLLLAGLTPPQWDALTGPSGLGLADLSDDSQRGLFEALLPSGDVKAYPQSEGLPPGSGPVDPIPLTAQDLRSGRLRLGRQTQILLPVAGDPNTFQGGYSSLLPGKTQYNVDAPDPPAAGDKMVYGAVLRQTLPNNPKDADLDYDAPLLARSVRLDGVATVGDLVARVGGAAGLELYADRRYEARPVTLLGRRTGRGVDLLRALAFCVTGTFRRVGPAYVLTDDLQGTIPRRQRLIRFVAEAEIARRAVMEAAGDSLTTARGGVDALPPLDGLGPSDAQKALPEDPQSGFVGMTRLPFAQLTPAQQEYAASQMREVNEVTDRFEQIGGHGRRLTLAGRLMFSARPMVFLLSPTVPGPITLPSLSAGSLYQPSFKLQREIGRRRQEDAARKNPPPAAPPPAPSPALASVLARLPRRAVLAAPRTAHEVDRVVSAMQALGLNQLWLDVFSGGHSHLDKPPSPLTPTTIDGGASSPRIGGGGASSLGAEEPDILTEALARTKGTGIAVIPALNLLRWAKDAPAEARDLTTLGETSAQQQAWRQHYLDVTMDLTAAEDPPAPPSVWVCPAAPVVEETLLALVRRLAATPGITTLALRDTVPTGYGFLNYSNYGGSDADLGYVPALRLAFLRRDHVDPLDLDKAFDLPGGVDVSLPEFGEWNGLGDALKDWNNLRDGVSRDLLRRLLAAAQEASGRRFRFLVRQRGGAEQEGWYGLWDNPQAPLPEVPIVPLKPGVWPPPSPWDINYAPAAHAQCRINLYALPPWAAASPEGAVNMIQQMKSGWDGVALDATDPASVDQLADLARNAAPTAPKSAPTAPKSAPPPRNGRGRPERRRSLLNLTPLSTSGSPSWGGAFAGPRPVPLVPHPPHFPPGGRHAGSASRS